MSSSLIAIHSSFKVPSPKLTIVPILIFLAGFVKASHVFFSISLSNKTSMTIT